MNETICIDTTHSLGDITPVQPTRYDRWGIPDYSNLIRKHLLILYFTTRIRTWIQTFRLIIVTDRWLDEAKGVWRELPTRSGKHKVTQESPSIVITLLVSGESNYHIQALSSDSLSSPGSLRILHDRTYLLNPDNNRLDFIFECIGGYVFLTDDEVDGDYAHSYVSTLRIFPTSIRSSIQQPSRVIPSLPINAIHQICKNLMSNLEADDIRGHAQLLTSCALICKRWYKSGVYDLLWPILIEKSYVLELEDNYLINLVHCLKRFPQIGESLSSLPRPTGLESGRSNIEEFRSIYGVLVKAAINLRSMNLISYQWDLVSGHLSPSHPIEYMHLSGLEKPIKLLDTLRIINGWIHLKRLCIETWKLEPNTQIPETRPAYELHKLVMGASGYGPRNSFESYDSLTLNIIQHFLSRPDSLQLLIINGITGLSQTDFETIFRLIKSTIVTLSVDDCLLTDFDESVANGEPERAFDAVVSEMHSLRKVTLNIKGAQRGLSSSLSILRRRENLSPTNSLWGEFKSSWTPSPDDTIHDLENALKVTGWKRVSLLVKWNGNDEFSVARRIARDRAISWSVLWV